MLTDKKGNKLFRKVEIKVIFPDNIFRPKTFVSHAGPHQGFNSEGIADLQMQVADKLEELYPFWEFRVVELKSNGRVARYVFMFAGYSKKQAVPAQVEMTDFTIHNPEESNTPTPETVETPRQQGRTATLETASQ